MRSKTSIGIQTLQLALVLGLVADILLRQMPWGLNVLLFNLAFVLGAAVLLRRRGADRLDTTTLALLGAQIFFAAMFVWRDSVELRVADSFAILAILSVLFVGRLRLSANVAGAAHYAIGFLWASLTSLFGPFLLVFHDVEWSTMPSEGWRKHSLAILRGVAIAAPLVLIFGALFMAADAAYEGLVQKVFDLRFELIFPHIFFFSAFAWLSAGYLRGILIDPIGWSAVSSEAAGDEKEPAVIQGEDLSSDSGEYPINLGDNSLVDHLNLSDPPQSGQVAEKQVASRSKWPNIENTILPAGFTLGTVEIAIVLGLMNLLFLSFVIVQLPYLFGGMDLVRNTPDLRLADYARRGFGELVAVSALVLPVLLATHWLIRKEARAAGRLYQVLAGTQIVLLFVIMASAVQRLVLLTGSLGYGLTTVRLYPLIFMSWLAVVFVWFAVTVLRGSRQYFAWGALWAGFVFLGATHVLDPDAFIVRTNVQLMREGRDFDAVYNSQLSDDSLPALVAAVPEMDQADQSIVAQRLRARYCRTFQERDIRSFNLARSRTNSMLGHLAKALGPCTPDHGDLDP